MADAAPSGDKWAPIEIIIVLILAIAFLSKLRGVSPAIFPEDRDGVFTTPQIEEKTKIVEKSITPKVQPATPCGLTVYRPKSFELVKNVVSVGGVVSGCNWEPRNNIALYLQVIDEHGLPLSDYVAVPVKEHGSKGATFSETIMLTQTSQLKKGYILLFSAKNDSSSQKQITQRIEIRLN